MKIVPKFLPCLENHHICGSVQHPALGSRFQNSPPVATMEILTKTSRFVIEQAKLLDGKQKSWIRAFGTRLLETASTPGDLGSR